MSLSAWLMTLASGLAALGAVAGAAWSYYCDHDPVTAACIALGMLALSAFLKPDSPLR